MLIKGHLEINEDGKVIEVDEEVSKDTSVQMEVQDDDFDLDALLLTLQEESSDDVVYEDLYAEFLEDKASIAEVIRAKEQEFEYNANWHEENKDKIDSIEDTTSTPKAINPYDKDDPQYLLFEMFGEAKYDEDEGSGYGYSILSSLGDAAEASLLYEAIVEERRGMYD